MAVIAALLLAPAAHAAVPDSSGQAGSFMNYDSMDLIGAPVKNPDGELLGLISRLEIDSGGHVLAVINHGSDEYYGPGGGYAPVPFEALKVSEPEIGQVQAVLNTDEKGLEAAPFFNPLKMNDRQYEAQIYQYYGLQPYWTAEANCIGDLQDLARSGEHTAE